MKVSINEQENIRQVEVVILCKELNSFVNILAKKIRQLAFFVSGYDEDKTEQIPIDEIYYFESVDNKTFIYCREKVYRCNMKLYELGENLRGTAFRRINKACILNLEKLVSAKGLINGRLLVELSNAEKLIVNRSYVSDLREYLKFL